jgi:precorrin-2 dehydrogenase/sirohydrochlorin ferrochelatase
VAGDLTAWLETQRELRIIEQVGTDYHPCQLDGIDLVFAATDNLAVNQRVAADAAERRVWCNMATDPQLGSFLVPAIVERGPLAIAISTSGASPAVAHRIRQALEQQFGPEWGPYLRLLASLRASIQQAQLGTRENQRRFREIALLPLPDWLRDGQRDMALRTLQKLCRPSLTYDELATLWEEACARDSS